MQTAVEMDTAFSLDTVIYDQLIERRQKLEEAVTVNGGNFEFANLLGQVDAALAKLTREPMAFARCATAMSNPIDYWPIRW
jgi:hypothetical protein